MEFDRFIFEKDHPPERFTTMKNARRIALTAPADDMWEAFGEGASQWLMKIDGRIAGFACVDDDNCLLQYYLSPEFPDSNAVLAARFIAEQKITSALVGTNDPNSICPLMNLQTSSNSHTYLFYDANPSAFTTDYDGRIQEALSDDLMELVSYGSHSTGAPEDWLAKYFGTLIAHKELFLFRMEGILAGTFEVRKSTSDSRYANVGMIVSSDFRRRGIGSYLLRLAKEKCYSWDRQPICSCEKDNIGSLKAIEVNGFRNYHQIIKMSFA